MWKKLLSVLVLVAILVAGIPGISQNVGALTLEEATAERERLQQQLIEINNKLAKIKDTVKKAEEKTATFADRKAIVENQINLLKESIDLKEEEHQIKQAQHDQKVRDTEETYELFKKRLRAMYMNKDASILTAVLGANSFSDFLVAAENLRRVSEHDTELIARLKKEQEEIRAARELVQQELDSLQVDRDELESKYNELAALYREANNELSSAEALENVTQGDYDAILADFDIVNKEWNALMGTGMPEYVGGYYAWPVPGFNWISSPYGPRTLYGKPNFHSGIDIAGAGIFGKPVIASNQGEVVRVRYDTTGYGYHVMIDHGGNNWTVYGHLSSIAVTQGQWVSQGQTIGFVGSTGNSTGPHLHFEIRLNGVKVDPLGQLTR
ncbi:MAG: peptidoglycan DD-metalloendopeptidase family protein [Oscillospiraceae bacterium]